MDDQRDERVHGQRCDPTSPVGNSTDEPKERCLLTGEVLQGPRWTPTDLPHDPGEGLLFGDPDMRGRRRRAGKSKSAVP